LPKVKRKNPKNSIKRSKKKDKQDNVIILGTFLVFIAVVSYLFYFLNLSPEEDIVVATVGGNDITRDELDWWYKQSILPEFRDIVTKQDFLTLSLIPQEVLVQEAKKENIKVDDDDVENLLGIYIIENGLTLEEFEEHLDSRGISIEDIKKNFETRALLIKLFEKQDIHLLGEELPDAYDEILPEYVTGLIENAQIEIFSENIEKLVLTSFEDTGDEVCGEVPIVRLYTTSSCEACDNVGKIFEDLVKDFDGIKAVHWSLDTGDDLLTQKKENGIPDKEVGIFKKYSPEKLVPTTVLGCKFKKIGDIGVEEVAEFNAILKTLIGE